jgi:hypothetical protein
LQEFQGADAVDRARGAGDTDDDSLHTSRRSGDMPKPRDLRGPPR